jgi:OTU domain-containing protein 3
LTRRHATHLPSLLLTIVQADYEHYSSVRNVNGPFEGPPNVTCTVEYSSEPSSQQSIATDASKVEDWRKQVVHDSLNFEASDNQVAQALLSTSGDVDGAVTKLMELQSPSPASTPGSSSVERDHDDDDAHAPNKRQDRRLSHATRAMMQRSHRQKLADAISNIHDRDSPIPSDTGSFRPERRESDTSMSTSESQKVEPTESSSVELSQTTGQVSIPNKPIRLKINNNAPNPNSPVSATSADSKIKPAQQQNAPSQRKAVSARDRKELKKQAQKQARKERAKSEAAEKGLPIMTKTERMGGSAPVTAIKL